MNARSWKRGNDENAIRYKYPRGFGIRTNTQFFPDEKGAAANEKTSSETIENFEHFT